MACCLVRPDGIHSLSPSSVKKKLKDKSFAAKVDRGDVYAGPERLGVSLDEHIQLVIDALVPHAQALGSRGRTDRPDERGSCTDVALSRRWSLAETRTSLRGTSFVTSPPASGRESACAAPWPGFPGPRLASPGRRPTWMSRRLGLRAEALLRAGSRERACDPDEPCSRASLSAAMARSSIGRGAEAPKPINASGPFSSFARRASRAGTAFLIFSELARFQARNRTVRSGSSIIGMIRS